MAFLKITDIRSRARMSAAAAGRSAKEILQDVARSEAEHYNVFLSQALKDAEIVYGIYAILTEDLGLTVYCDWMDTEAGDHSQTTAEDAAYVRRRMQASDVLLLIDTDGAAKSSWMSWELGWFSGNKGKAAVVPIVERDSDPYRGREFLGLYPTVEHHDEHLFEVKVPLSLVGKRYPAGSILGIATKMPLRFWVLPHTQLPEPYW